MPKGRAQQDANKPPPDVHRLLVKFRACNGKKEHNYVGIEWDHANRQVEHMQVCSEAQLECELTYDPGDNGDAAGQGVLIATEEIKVVGVGESSRISNGRSNGRLSVKFPASLDRDKLIALDGLVGRFTARRTGDAGKAADEKGDGDE